MAQSQFILLVEDEAFIALMLQDLLESAGFAVVAAHTTSDAQAILNSRPTEIGALITDIRLGDNADGWELARQARQHIPHVPIAYMSGGGEADHRALGVPKSVMFIKPFTGAQFLGGITALMEMSSKCVLI